MKPIDQSMHGRSYIYIQERTGSLSARFLYCIAYHVQEAAQVFSRSLFRELYGTRAGRTFFSPPCDFSRKMGKIGK